MLVEMEESLTETMKLVMNYANPSETPPKNQVIMK